MRVVKASKILADLKRDGWYLVRCRGSHRQFHHPTKKGSVTINAEGNDDIYGNNLKSIESQSGLKF